MDNSLTKIMLVDDHNIFRAGIKLLIEQEKLGAIIAEAENGKQFVEQLKVHDPDLVLMDIDMPVMDGIKATKAAVEINPDIKILVLSMFGDEKFYVEMINAGAKGFVLKSSSKNELETALKTVASGESYFSNDLLRKIITHIETNQIKPGTNNKEVVEFNEHELEVLQLLSKGLSTNEIADDLALSPKTIDVYRSKLITKTNSKNTVSLVIYAIKNGLIKI